MNTPTPLEELLRVTAAKRSVTIGLPSADSLAERRFPLTPEAAAMIVERGFTIKMEAGAAETIHFPDSVYARVGVQIVDRAEALRCDIVVHLPAIALVDALRLKNGSLLLTFFHLGQQNPDAVRVLLQRHVIALALDLISDEAGHRPFADILNEINGRAAIAVASSLLADAVHGKGILLGGVAGIVPCEVTIIGSDIAARAAALSAMGLGATVRMFDNDVYRLREALAELRSGVIGSAMHPRALISALRTADIVIVTSTEQTYALGIDAVAEMKRGVLAFDLSDSAGDTFPNLRRVDLGAASPFDTNPAEPVRTCYINAGNAVPRTAAMALSNTLTTMLDKIVVCDGVSNALKLNKGLAKAAYTFLGRPVNAAIASLAGVRHMDIDLFLQFS